MTLPIKTGIELELWVTDRDGELADGRAITEAHPRIEGEFVPCLLEVKTHPHETEQGLREDLHALLRTAIDAAADHDRRLVPLGTPLTEAKMDATGRRGELFEAIYGDGVLAAKNCAGSHIHFETTDVCRQLNLLTALDPALALVSSSPYYRGERSQTCSRAVAYRSDCGTECQQFCQLLDYVDSVAEWEDRTDRLYAAFRDLARRRDVPDAAVREHFRADDAVLNPVRLQQTQPTVEWRAPDSTLPSHVVSLAVDVGSLVAQTESKPLEYGTPGVTDSSIDVPAFERLQELSRRGMERGSQAPAVRNYLEAMGFDVEKYAPLSRMIDGRSVLSERGGCRARLAQSVRLERDLSSLRDGHTSGALRCPPVSAARTRENVHMPVQNTS